MRNAFILLLALTGIFAGKSQNETDVLRYAQLSPNASTRFNSMGGAFGALGADMGCAAFNPAGLGIFRKGELSYSAQSRVVNNRTSLSRSASTSPQNFLTFNGFGFLVPWVPEDDKASRNVIGFNVVQLANFWGTTNMSAYTNSSSIAKDMVNVANTVKDLNQLNNFYEGLGYDTYLLDYDSTSRRYFSYLDVKRSVLQTRSLASSGRMNEVNFSYARSVKEDFYFGASVGIPRVSYASTITHTESDDRDSMRVLLTSPGSYSTTYVDGLPAIYTNLLGFNSLTYTEYFNTKGSGVNLKLGFVGRVGEAFRVGAYYHTKTFFSLTDTYYNSLKVSFDKNPSSPSEKRYPDKDGIFDYKLITPSRLGLCLGYVYKQILAVGLDYETANYKVARLDGGNVSDFATPNDFMFNNFARAHNLRVGVEVNTRPLMYRVGYNVVGNAYGNVFQGNAVRSTFSLGIGFRTKKNFCFDFGWSSTQSSDVYRPFKTLDTGVNLSLRSTSIMATAGYKF